MLSELSINLARLFFLLIIMQQILFHVSYVTKQVKRGQILFFYSMQCRHHQLHAGILVLQCDLPLLSYGCSNFSHCEN